MTKEKIELTPEEVNQIRLRLMAIEIYGRIAMYIIWGIIGFLLILQLLQPGLQQNAAIIATWFGG